MSTHLKFVLCELKKPVRESLSKMLSSINYMFLEAECSCYASLEDALSTAKPDLMVIGIDENVDEALSIIRRHSAANPNLTTIAVSGRNDGPTILDTMRAGAKEFLTTPVEMAELASAIQRVCKLTSTNADRRSSQSVIAVAGATGGVGATSLAVNIAAEIARNPESSVALLDLDLSVGDADIFLDCIPEYTLIDVATNVSRLDLSLLKKSMTKHESGVYLLPRPVALVDNEIVTPDNMGRVLSLMKTAFSHLVIDLSKGYTPVDMVALQSADHVLLVTQLDLPCLRNIVRLLMSLEEIPGLISKVKIVVNRSGLQSNRISIKKAEETIGQKCFWQVPNDYAVMAAMRNNGIPLILQSPQAGITLSISGLTNALLSPDDEPQGAAVGKKPWLGFLSRK